MDDTTFPYQREIALSQLLVDLQNPRLPDIQDSQRDTIQSMVRSQGNKILELALHLLENGPNPASLPIVIPSEEEEEMFEVVDGNRRITALKLLETPGIAQGVFENNGLQRLQRLSTTYHEDPIKHLRCIVFENREAADPWVQLIHRGEQQGAGLVEWDGQVAARYDSRKGNKPAALQILDFVKLHATLSSATRQRIDNGRFPITTLVRLITSPYIREKLGIELSDGQILSHYPQQEILKGLTQIFEDLGRGIYTVSALKSIDQRLNYIDGFNEEQLPSSNNRLPMAVPIEMAPSIVDISPPVDVGREEGVENNNPGVPEPQAHPGTTANGNGGTANGTGSATPGPSIPPASGGGQPSNRRPPTRSRLTLIPRDCRLSIGHHRIHSIYNEIKRLNIDEFANAGAVMLRVFLELSLDYFIELKLSWNEQKRINSTLAMKLNAVATYMEQNAILTTAELEPIRRAAAGQTLLAAAIRTMNGYVHSRHYSPVGSELKVAWDDLQRFIEQLWLNI